MMALLGYNWSVATAIGFIALAGVATEIGVVMLVYLDQARDARRKRGQLADVNDLLDAVREGAGQRLRPVLMTATAVIAGLLPIFWGEATGASVMKRIAAPMVGGMVSATMLTLLVIPAIYSLWQESVLGSEVAAQAETAEAIEGGSHEGDQGNLAQRVCPGRCPGAARGRRAAPHDLPRTCTREWRRSGPLQTLVRRRFGLYGEDALGARL